MAQYKPYETRPTSLISFIIIGIVLAGLLLAGVFFGKKYILSAQQPSDGKAVAEKVQKSQDEINKRLAEQKRRDAQKKAAAEQAEKEREARIAAQKAAEEKRIADEKAAQAQAAQQSQPPVQTQPPATTPSHVASTGPEDTLLTLVGIIALSYAGYGYFRSQRDIQKKNS
jgi:FtsZ-interacting cell division protein ZipA